MIHHLKILDKFMANVLDGSKTFEIRKNDRNFQVGDEVTLLEIGEHDPRTTGRVTTVIITYITEYMQREGFCVFSFRNKEVAP